MVKKRLEEVGKRPCESSIQDTPKHTLKVAVCIASTATSYPSKFTECLSNMTAHFQQSAFDGEHEIRVFTTHGSILPEVRHRLVGDAIGWDATHVLMLSPELTFPPDSVHRLLMRGRGAIGVNYLKDYAKKEFSAYRGKGTIMPDERLPETEEVDGVALGMVLFNMPLFDCIDLPFFKYEQVGDTPAFAEDYISFWEQCREKKIPCVIDHELSKEVKSLHYGELWH